MVRVPAAALFSNTRYATLRYGVEHTEAFSHTMSFSVSGGSGFETGYTTTATSSIAFGADPGLQWYVQKKHYAATYRDEIQGSFKTGISGAEQAWDWGALLTSEYINPNDLNPNSYKEFELERGLFKEASYTETSDYVWRASLGVPFAVIYQAFGNVISLDTTVTTTSGNTNSVYWLVDRRGDYNPQIPQILTFRVYTSGTFYCYDNGLGGMELHIWDMSGAG